MSRSRFRKGVFSYDVLVATLLVSMTLALMLYALVASAESFSRQAAITQREQKALVFADKLLKKCPWSGGLAECGNGFVYSHQLDDAFLKKIAGTSNAAGVNGFITVSSIDGEMLYEAGGVVNATNCVTRIALLRGKQVLLKACVE